MPHEVSAEQQPARLAFLVAKFRKAVRRQRQQDDANLASLLRAVRRGGPDVEQLCRLINLRGADAYAGRGRRDEEHDR